jgi:type IV secretion system protein VirB2
VKKGNGAQGIGLWKYVMLALVLFLPELALAEPWDDTADKVLEIFTGGLTRTLAVIAIIVAGVLAMFGKMQWSWVINIVIGIVLIFGGAAIVDYIIAAAS